MRRSLENTVSTVSSVSEKATRPQASRAGLIVPGLEGIS